MKIEVFTGYIYCDYSGKQAGFLFRDVNEKLVFLSWRIKTNQLGHFFEGYLRKWKTNPMMVL